MTAGASPEAAAAETPLRAAHEALGAAPAPYFGCLLPESYGDLAEEYRRAREAAALFDTSYHAVFHLTGPDRVRYLNAVVTNNVKDLAAGQGTLALLLNPQGHILAELRCHAQADRLLVLSHALVRLRTAETLEKYIIMDDVTLEDATERFGSLAVEGPRAGALLHQVCGVDIAAMEAGDHGEITFDSLPCRLVRWSHFGELGAELFAERQRLPQLWARLLEAVRGAGGGPIGYAALNALRLEAGIPWFGYDFDDSVIPHEAALEESHISYNKGCYTGQEIVERVRSRGHVNRRRVGLRFDGAAPARGTRLLAGEKDVGHVTSAAHSPGLGAAVGMGYVRREHFAPGTRLACAAGTAEVIALRRRPATPGGT